MKLKRLRGASEGLHENVLLTTYLSPGFVFLNYAGIVFNLHNNN